MGDIIKLPLSDSGISNQVRGTILVGDIGANAGALTVTGGLISASATVPSAGVSNITLTFPAVTNPIVSITVEGIGSDILDNDLVMPIIRSLTSTSLDIFVEESAVVVQNVIFHITITAQ